MKNTSVALLLDSAPRTWTSQEDIHLQLCEALRARGVKLTLVFSERISDQLSKRFRECGAAIEVANYREGRLSYLKRLREIVARHRVSLIHVCFFDYFSAVPWLARFSGTKNVLYEQLNSGQHTATSWKKHLIQLRGALATGAAARVIAISNFIKEELIECGVPGEKIIVRHLGVDTNRFVPDPEARNYWATRLDIRPEEIILSTVSVLRGFKNPQTIVEACGLLAQRSVPFRLLVAGDGEMLTGLKQLADDLGISQQTHWLGYCADPKSVLQASDLFVLASVGEAFGLVLAEAMACGVPIVGSRSGSLLEVVNDGHTGLLATPLDADAFAVAIETLAKDDGLRKKMGRQAVAHVHAKFTVEKTAEETIRVYESLWN